jgi:glutamate formiminotransferase
LVVAREPLLECVPNVSEGRDAAVIKRLAGAIRGEGIEVVDAHRDVDHHRSVFTCLGPGRALEAAMLALARAAVAAIDLRVHEGVHPRVGALDVVPFVPLRGASMDDAVDAARRVGRALAVELGVPVFFYGAAATREHGRELVALRRGGLAALAELLGTPGGAPDAGPPALHPTAGATLVGARGPLVAFNALLEGADVGVARAIARAIRESSGGLPAVQAMGVWLGSRARAQVSMNLLDYRRTPPRLVAELIEGRARSAGAAVSAYELVGCAPADAVADWPSARAPIAGLKASQLLDPALFAPR